MFLDVDTASFFRDEDAGLSRRVGEELKALSRRILSVMPGATVLLTGSLSIGEGRLAWRAGRRTILSDYDLVVVTRRAAHCMPALVKGELDRALQGIELSADLEITLVWQAVLQRQLTTTGGAIIAGPEDVSELLRGLPCPRAASALLHACCSLAQAPLRPQESSALVSRALTRGAQAILLHRCDGAPRRRWIGLSSIACVQDRVQECSPVIGSAGVRAVQRAGDGLLTGAAEPSTPEDYRAAVGMLQRVGEVVAPRPCLYYAMKHGLWLRHERLRGVPRSTSGASALEALQLLAEAWEVGVGPHEAMVAEASRAARRLWRSPVGRGGEASLKTYAGLFGLLSSYVRFYPHKLRYGRRSSSRR